MAIRFRPIEEPGEIKFRPIEDEPIEFKPVESLREKAVDVASKVLPSVFPATSQAVKLATKPKIDVGTLVETVTKKAYGQIERKGKAAVAGAAGGAGCCRWS